MRIVNRVTTGVSKLLPKDLMQTTGLLKSAVNTGWKTGREQALVDNRGLVSDVFNRSRCVAKEVARLKFTTNDIPVVAAAIGYIAPVPIPGLTLYAYAMGIGIKKLVQLSQRVKLK